MRRRSSSSRHSAGGERSWTERSRVLERARPSLVTQPGCCTTHKVSPVDLTALFAEERGMKVDVTEGDVGEMVTSRKDRALDWHGSLWKGSGEEDHIMLDIRATEDLCNQGIAATDDSPKYSYSADNSPKYSYSADDSPKYSYSADDSPNLSRLWGQCWL
ncbi:unnamed protein product [Oncorhynchus mykiss]|uniref:Uncharacterized protein n=1 Tax=Oncorhynchus mykiss TaxID=8022 RepID=A0A060X8Q1_ONCMY|nr:unnamed protein product [Oncorhynchus mykiss]